MSDSTPAGEALGVATKFDWASLAAALEALTVEWFQPLNVVLVVAIVMFARFMHKANQRPDFSLVDALRGPDGKCSMKLIGYLVGIISGTWLIMDCAGSWLQQPTAFVQLFVVYILALVVPKIAAEWVQAKYSKPHDQEKPEERR